MINQLREAFPHIDWVVRPDVPTDAQDLTSYYSATHVEGHFECRLYCIVVSEERTCFSSNYVARLEWGAGLLLGAFRDDPLSAVAALQSIVGMLNENLQPKQASGNPNAI